MGDSDSESVLEASVIANADIDSTWAYLMTPRRWWPGTTIEPRVGGELREEWTNGSGVAIVTTGVIDLLEPPHRVEMSWADSDWPSGVATHVAFELRPAGGQQTEIRLRHSGWTAFGVEASNLRAAHRAGWHHHLHNLAVAAAQPAQ